METNKNIPWFFLEGEVKFEEQSKQNKQTKIYANRKIAEVPNKSKVTREINSLIACGQMHCFLQFGYN